MKHRLLQVGGVALGIFIYGTFFQATIKKMLNGTNAAVVDTAAQAAS